MPAPPAGAAPRRRRESKAARAARAAEVLAAWDRSADAQSRGAVLFFVFCRELAQRLGGAFGRGLAVKWDPARPLETPDGFDSGLADDGAGAPRAEPSILQGCDPSQTEHNDTTEQSRYGAALVEAASGEGWRSRDARVLFGGDLNVFPRPDDPFAPGDALFPSDQLGPLYDEAGMDNLWDELRRRAPASAYTYVFEGQARGTAVHHGGEFGRGAGAPATPVVARGPHLTICRFGLVVTHLPSSGIDSCGGRA